MAERVRVREIDDDEGDGCCGSSSSHIALLLFDTRDATARNETLALTWLLIDEAAAEGYGEYRTHNALMGQVMGTYSWNDGALLKFHEAVKDALDPNGIIAPGKSGVWPARYRGRGL